MRIAIVGLGLGGASAAAALHQYGADITVFEQAPEIREVGAGIASSPSTIRLLARLGLEDKLAAIGCPSFGNGIHNAAGELLHKVTLPNTDGKPAYFFHRAELLETIASAVPPERIRLGQRCTGATEKDAGVELRFENGAAQTFDLVIGADGIKSVVLGSVVPPAPPIFANLVAYRGLVPNTPEIAMTGGSLWTDLESYFVAYPVSSGKRVNFAGFVPSTGRPEESWFDQGKREDLIAFFSTWDPLIGRIVRAVETTFRWGLYYRDPLPHIRTRRIALMGDAAHPMLPAVGMGAAQAIEDAFALAELLRDCSPADVPERLAIYEELRLPRASAVQATAIANAQFMHKSFPVDPDKPRPQVTASMEWILNYDIVSETRKLLQEKIG
jgi:salicylate hydroxylase